MNGAVAGGSRGAAWCVVATNQHARSFYAAVRVAQACL